MTSPIDAAIFPNSYMGYKHGAVTLNTGLDGRWMLDLYIDQTNCVDDPCKCLNGLLRPVDELTRRMLTKLKMKSIAQLAISIKSKELSW